MGIDQNVALFCDMVGCCHNIYLWSYDCTTRQVISNCPEQAAMYNLLELSMSSSEFGRELGMLDTPVLITNEMGMIWLAQPCFEKQRLTRNYILGPFFADDISAQNIEAQLIQHGISGSLLERMMFLVHRLPIISWSRVQEYAIMFHFCVTGGKINVSDLRHYTKSKGLPILDGSPYMEPDAHGTYRAEQEMLRMVREGNLQLREHIDRISITGNIGKMSNGEPMRQAKNSALLCVTLFSRAAIEGGLNPEVSYTLANYYFQAIESCKTYSELSEITCDMQDNYVQRVHQYHMSQYSHAIQQCCDYISLHLEEKITLDQLAKRTGYTTYYLSKKFKQEVGSTPAEYIRRQRLKRAAYLLRVTHEDIQDISIQLQFSSQSYFSESFRREFGMTPTKYRRKNT